jgi:hypothetical protein
MRQFAALLALAVMAVATGCGHSSAADSPASVTISPTSVSLTFGGVQQLSATVEDAAGSTLSNAILTYTTSDSSVADVSTGGLVCAGTWDSESTPVVCTQPKSTATRSATITATAQVTNAPYTASGTVTAYVHLHIDSVVVTAPASSSCISQAGATSYSAAACNRSSSGAQDPECNGNGTNLGNVGVPGWAVLPSSVASANTSSSCTTFANNTYPCLITASAPGQATVSASIASTVSSSVFFTTCPVTSITVKDSNGDTSASLSSSGTSTLEPVVVDSNGVTLTSLPTLNYSTSASLVASVSGTTVTASDAGTSTIVLSCSPPNCNTGLFPVYGNIYGVSVSGTTSTTVYVASSNSTSLVPITTSNNTVGTAISLPVAPNSMIISPTAAKIVLGTGSNTGSTGVMVYTVGSTISTLPVYGRVLAVSPDGNIAVLLYGPNEGNSGTAAIYVYDLSGSTLTSIPLSKPYPTQATAAFSPDSTQALVAASSPSHTNDQLAVWNSSTAPHVYSVASANDVDFLAEGSFAYVTGTDNVNAYASCSLSSNLLGTGDETPDILTASIVAPTLIRAVPNSTSMVVTDPPNIDLITANGSSGAWPGGAIFSPPSSCLPPWFEATPVHPNSITATSLNAGSYTPNQLITTADGTKAIVLADLNSVLLYNISGNVASAISLANGAKTTTGGVTLDSGYLWVGGSDGNVHVVNFSTSSDSAQVSPGITPEFVVVLP